MNRNCYRLVFNPTLSMMVPAPETARSRGKSGQGKVAGGAALALAGVLLAGMVCPNVAQAELPVQSAGGAIPDFVSAGQAAYQVNGSQAFVNQVGDKSILNWQSFNISPGHDVQFRQVDGLATNNLVQGANFTSLNRIWDINPSVIAGSITQAAGQQANVILVNSNGIAFMGGSQVNLNQFTASTLDIKDSFILDNFLPFQNVQPQFGGALEGGAARGFIKVLEGAKITAGSFGRVMLLAPTVVNKGKVEAPDGQVIVAAASKVYLRASEDANVRGLLIEVDSSAGLSDFDTANPDVKNSVLDGQEVSLVNPAEDKLGHVTNLGELTTPRGNVTMVGYVVNQQGIARATTSVVSNGSVYLLAKDTATEVATQRAGSLRGGRVTLGQNSLTEILPDVSDTTTVQDGPAGIGLDKPSSVQILGQDIRLAGASYDQDGKETIKGAHIVAPAGKVSLTALDDPSTQLSIFVGDSPVSQNARVHIASGAKIDVAGLNDVEVAAGRSTVEIDLRGDELKDSPVNQQGPLRGQKVYLDVDRALANAQAGKPTLVALDTLQSLKAQQQRGVAERSTLGGTVEVFSQGEAIIESGVVIDLSGGSLKFTPGSVKTTLLTANGHSVDLADANAETRYDGIATRYVRDFGRWNVQEVIDLGQSFRFDPGYTEGKDAGSLAVFGSGGLFAQPTITGRTVTGERQREMGIQPKGARWTVGYDDVVGGKNIVNAAVTTRDYKLNQMVALSAATAALPSGFRFGDLLPADLKSALHLDSTQVGKDKVAQLQVFSNQTVAVRDALRAPQGGSVAIIGSGVTVNADIEAFSGTIDLAARTTRDTVPASLPAEGLPDPRLEIADGVTLSVRGAWVNDLPSAGVRNNDAPLINGGKIKLSAETLAGGVDLFIVKGEVALGQGVELDADGGGRIKPDGKIAAGKGGEIGVSGFTVTGLAADTATAYGLEKGGQFTLSSGRIQIGGTPDTEPGALKLDTGFFERGGFAEFGLTALTQLTLAEGVHIKPRVKNRELQTGYTLRPTGSGIKDFSQIVTRDDRLRQATHLTLVAKQKDAFTGEILIGQGARIDADPEANITLEARNLIDIQGRITAPGGTITALLDNGGGERSSFNNLWLGKEAVLDVSGKAFIYIDNRGLVQGEVLAGGTVNLNAVTGSVVTETGSRIDVSGAAPVRLDVPNEAGGLGRQLGSDAGTVKVFVQGAALLDGDIAAHAGGVTNRGGSFDLTLGVFVSPNDVNTPPPPKILHVRQSSAPQTTGLASSDPVTGLDTRITADHLEAAGFDRVVLASQDAISLEDGLDLGANRALPLREIKLDAAAILTEGGNAALTAETIRLGNYEIGRRAASSASTTTGVLSVNARQLELAGKLNLQGMARAELKGSEEIRLAGLSSGAARPLGEFNTAADVVFHGAVVAPTTYTQYSILAPGKNVTFTRNTDAPVQPLSALGSLTVEAQDIVQDGNIWAPFGQIDFRATDTLSFKSGSLTSVSAAPDSLTPFGRVLNGRSWVYDVNSGSVPDGQLEQPELAEKSIRTSGKIVDMQAGAKLDLAGGGDLQAYEFTVGPGGSRDILTDKNTYAILPGYASGFAPGDAQEAQGFNRNAGDAVYLSGVPGLADGVYTLLPAHYALLPGAYAVKLDTGAPGLLPGQAYSRKDGVRVAAGYVTDSRANAPRDANWQGIQVLTRDQVRARSEITLTRASEFFADGNNRPQDAGLLSIITTGTGSDSLKLDAIYKFDAGSGGRGAAVDISALKLAITSGTPSGIDPDVVQIDVDKLNAMGAESLFIGGTRSVGSDTTTLTVGADSVVLANDADHALQAAEVILAAKDTLTLKSGSLIDAQGPAEAESDDATHYETAGEGALVRAAATGASFARTGSPPGILITLGTLVGEAGSKVIAADSITLDATRDNAFKGVVEFSKEGVAVAGNLGVGATRINFGAAPTGSEGITYSQADLDALNSLESMALTSYSTFDLYGDVNVGGVDGNGKPTLQNLTLLGAGLAGLNNSGQTANLRAQNLTLANPATVTYTPPGGGALGDGTLAILADRLTWGEGDKAIQGYGNVSITANEMLGEGVGKIDIAAPTTTINVARISGSVASDQTLTSNGALTVANHTADRTLAAVNALGAKWALAGTSVGFNTQAVLPSGQFKLTATGGDVTLGANASIDVAGRSVQFFDVSRPTWGGTAKFVSDTGNVTFTAGSKVDVSAAPGSDAGTLIVHAANGTVTLADGSVQGASPVDTDGKRGDGARVDVDTGTLASFSALNTVLNSGGFDGERTLRVRSGDVSVTATDTVKAETIRIAADGGKLDVAGKLDASGADAGRIELFAKNDVSLLAGAQLDAVSSGAGEDGGAIEIGTRDGSLDFASGSAMNVAGGSGGAGGKVLLRAPRTETDVAVNPLDTTITGASSVAIEAVEVYDDDNITTLTARGGGSGTLSLSTINADNTAFAANHDAIKTRLKKTGDAAFHILSGVEVRSAGDLTLGTGTANTDWNLKDSRAGGEPGVLTLRAVGNLNINSNLSDGFSHATPCTTPTCNARTPVPAMLRLDDSWSYRLIAGADNTAADPLAVTAGSSDVTLAAGKLVRTGTGDIRIASGRNIILTGNNSAIYTAGRVADAVSGFVTPANPLQPVFAQGGGNVSFAALGDITGQPSAQLYSDWLYRQGLVNPAGAYVQQPAWWVRFDQFRQGIGALGGGEVTLRAGGNVKDVSVSTPTQGRMAATTPDASQLTVTGGGDLRIESGGDVLGGSYYTDRGELVIKAGGKIARSDRSINADASPLDTLLALGDAQARVQALGDVSISNVLNPHLIPQSAGNLANVGSNVRRTLFSTYSADSSAEMQSLAGQINFSSGELSTFAFDFNGGAGNNSALSGQLPLASGLLPASLLVTAFQGEISLGAFNALTLSPAPHANLSLLAATSVKLKSDLTLSDMNPSLIPDAVRPSGSTGNSDAVVPSLTASPHAATPVHTGDTTPVRVYAVTGDIKGDSDGFAVSVLNTAKATWMKAGRDVRNFGMQVQHVPGNDISRVEAGRDILLGEGSAREDFKRIWIGGTGRLEVSAGRDLDLGTSGGIVSRGNLDNPNLPRNGADLQLAAGVGATGVDYQGAVDRLVAKLEAGTPDDVTLWQARWLTANTSLSAGDALTAVKAVDTLDAESQRERVRDMLFTALRATGRDFNDPASPFAGDYSRGYAALETVFPGIGEKNAEGGFKNYFGNIDLFASRVKTQRGGNIEFLLPGGDLIIGLSNTPADLVRVVDGDVLGMVVADEGDIKGFARDDILVNQSRILTVGGGDVLLWSSEGDIDAGKGKKTASAVPPPVIKVDPNNGKVTQELQGAVTGSGIGALSTGNLAAGDVDLIAPRGTVNAGDAGIRAGNLNIAAQVVLGADNISVSGTSAGTPVADTSAVTATSSGAVTAGDEVSKTTAALAQNLADATRAAEQLKQAFKPSFVSVEVVGFGE